MYLYQVKQYNSNYILHTHTVHSGGTDVVCK